MFGDYFGQRADYSRGMFYGGHRRYLHSEGGSAIEPPAEFRSKRQLRQLKLSRQRDSRNEDKISFQMNFQKKAGEIDLDNDNSNVKKFRKVANIVRNTITLDHFSSVQKDDWVEQMSAGVKLWVNRETGEVASECPWDNVSTQTPLQRMIRAKSQQRRSSVGSAAVHPIEGMGTGCLVYDGTEVEELFQILDSTK